MSARRQSAQPVEQGEAALIATDLTAGVADADDFGDAPLAIHRQRHVRVTVSVSTSRWLTAFAKANGITAGELLAQAAFCFADHAGRRCGSWEGSVAGDMARSCGYQQDIGWQARIKIIDREDRDLAEWRATLPPDPAELLTRATP